MIYTYAFYVVTSIALTIWVGRTLNKNGRVFLIENFEGKDALADSVNHLLLVGFYLINVGFVTLALKYGDKPVDYVGAIEFLSTKIGIVIVVLGGMHFFNMYWLVRFRKSRLFSKLASREETADIWNADTATGNAPGDNPAPQPAG
jgi:membrane-bound ClpP family serine protease